VKVSFLGLGRMGHAIAGRLADAEYDLLVWNRTPGRAGELTGRGAVAVDSPREACAGRDVVITMLSHDDALRQLAFGEDGIVANLPPGSIHVVMGTHGVDAVIELAARHEAAGQALVAAPVLGRPDAAAAGELGIIVGGPAEAVERCRGLLAAIGRRTFAAGERAESAMAIKLANNFVLGGAIEVMAEAFDLARGYDVKPAVLYEVLTGGLFAAPAYKVYGQIIVEEDYDRVGFTVELALKDINLALAAGGHAAIPLPSAGILRDRLLGAMAHGDADRDWAVLAREQTRASASEATGPRRSPAQ
jgi:3-hydroxyisobutyrate dehydrogenase-like beta-hydroxyacid dehydrogenase